MVRRDAASRTGGRGLGVRAARVDRRAGARPVAQPVHHGRHHDGADPRERRDPRRLDRCRPRRCPRRGTVAVPRGRRAGRRPAADARHDAATSPTSPRSRASCSRCATRTAATTRGSTSSARPPTAPAAATSCCTYADGSTQNVAVSFPDWCQSGHSGDRPAEQALDAHRVRTARRARSSTCRRRSTRPRSSCRSQLPPSTAGGPPEVGVPDGADARAGRAGTRCSRMPDLSGREPCAADDRSARHRARVRSGRRRTAAQAGTPARVADLAGTRPTRRAARASSRCCTGSTAARSRPYSGEIDFDDDGEHTLEYRAIDCAGNAEAFKSVDFKVDAHAPSTAARLSPGTAFGPDGWYDGAVAVALAARDGAGLGHRGERVPDRRGRARPPTRGTITVGGGRLPRRRGFRCRRRGPATSRPERSAPVRSTPRAAADVGADQRRGAEALVHRRRARSRSCAATATAPAPPAWVPPRRRRMDALFRRVRRARTGAHRVDYRSRDVVGNRSSSARSGSPYAEDGVERYAPAPFASLAPPRAQGHDPAGAAARQAVVRITCQGVDRGTLSLRVDRATARRLGLGRRVLAERPVRCGDEGRASVRLRPGGPVRRRSPARARASTRG